MAPTAPTAPTASAPDAPLVWILAGLPGDEEREEVYGEIVGRIAGALTGRFGLKSEDLTVLFGAAGLREFPACNAESFIRELDRICQLSQSSRPIWVFLIGHSSSTRNDAQFNIAGPDLSATQIGERLKGARPDCQMTIIVTTEASGKYIERLSAPGRVVISATDPKEPDNETEFPLALAETLEDPRSDLDGDGSLSAFEIFQETKRRVEETYAQQNLIQREKALLDGNGDGRGTMRPADADAEPARKLKLRIQRGN